jgi:hypothetical protein
MIMMIPSTVLQIDEVFGLLENAGFVWAMLIATWGVLSFRFFRGRRGGPKVGPTHQQSSASFPLKHGLSEEEVFKILTTDETNIQIVRICEAPKSAREVSRGLGEIYPGHKEKGFPADKLGEHLANLERMGAVRFNGEKWAATDVGMKMVRKYFG